MRATRKRERKIGERITRLKTKTMQDISSGKTIREVARIYDIHECTLGYYIRYWKTGEKGKQIKEETNKRATPAKRRYIRIDKRKKPEDQKLKRFRYTRENAKDKKELECILAGSRVIHWSIFIKNVEKEFLDKWIPQEGQALVEDPEVNYYRSVTPEGKEVYYFTHKGSEYIFY